MLRNSAESLALSATRQNNHQDNNHQSMSLVLNDSRLYHHQFNDTCDFCSLDSCSCQLVTFDPVSDPSKVHGHHGKDRQQLRCCSEFVDATGSVTAAGGRFPLQTFTQGLFTQTLINYYRESYIFIFKILIYRPNHLTTDILQMNYLK